MPDEAIDVLDASGDFTGRVKLKSDVHRDGDWHRSVHVWIVTPDGRFLLQKRAATKQSHPNLWDISAAGHISAGEGSVVSAVREIEEELGLSVAPEELRLVAQSRIEWSLNEGRFLENEFHDIYMVRRDVDIGSLRLQASEVDDARLVTIDELRALAERRDASLVPHWHEYELMLRLLSS